MRALLIASFGILSIAGLLHCGAEEIASEEVSSPILNGTSSDRQEVVLLANADDEPACSGTLIAPKVVLTAAHCMRSVHHVYVGFSKAMERNVAISVGDKNKLRYEIVRKVTHPSWTGGGACPYTANDVGLVKLERAVPFGTPIADLSKTAPAVGEECVVVGYGRHNPDNNIETVESMLTDPTVGERREARVTVAGVLESSFSAKGIDGAHSRGDSGGPIFCGSKIAGIVSCTDDRDATVLNLVKHYASAMPVLEFIRISVKDENAGVAFDGTREGGIFDSFDVKRDGGAGDAKMSADVSMDAKVYLDGSADAKADVFGSKDAAKE